MQRLLFTVLVVALAALAAAPARAATDDQARAEQIATHLRDSGRMRDYSVGVKYSAGTVWLSGRVASSQQMQNALEVVSEADGVEKIVNNLAIGPSAQSGGQSTAKKTAAESASFSQPSPASQWDTSAIETPSIPRDNAAQPTAAPVKTICRFGSNGRAARPSSTWKRCGLVAVPAPIRLTVAPASSGFKPSGTVALPAAARMAA